MLQSYQVFHETHGMIGGGRDIFYEGEEEFGGGSEEDHGSPLTLLPYCMSKCVELRICVLSLSNLPVAVELMLTTQMVCRTPVEVEVAERELSNVLQRTS